MMLRTAYRIGRSDASPLSDASPRIADIGNTENVRYENDAKSGDLYSRTAGPTSRASGVIPCGVAHPVNAAPPSARINQLRPACTALLYQRISILRGSPGPAAGRAVRRTRCR